MDSEQQLVKALEALGSKVDRLSDKMDGAVNTGTRTEERVAALTARVLILEACRPAERLQKIEDEKTIVAVANTKRWDLTKTAIAALSFLVGAISLYLASQPKH